MPNNLPHSLTAREVAAILKAKPCGDGYTARCPSHHPDKKPSLSIGEGEDGKLLLTCHANKGCTYESILAAIPHANGNNGARREVAHFNYRNENGNLLHQVVRSDPKQFLQRQPGDGGDWVWNLKGVRRVPYRLPELLAADPSQQVFIPEGEGKCDALAKRGLLATCNSGGAGKWVEKDGSSKYNKYLAGRHCVVLPDCDVAGLKHAEQVATSLQGIAASVKVIHLPGLDEKGDIKDWLAKPGNDVDALCELVEAAPLFSPSSVRVHTPNTANTANDREHVNDGNGVFVGEPMSEWLRQAATQKKPNRLAGEFWREGELVLGFGTTGEGKTAAAVQIANDIARGYTSTGLEVEIEASKDLYFDFELSAAQHLSRYSDSGGIFEFSENLVRVELDISVYTRGVELVNDWELALLNQIESYILESNARIVFIDNITWLSRETDKGKFALPLMQRLVNLKKNHGLSVCVLAHTPKRDETRPLCLNDLAGSRILANFADSIFALGKSASDPSVRYLKQIKSRSAETLYTTENVATFTFEKRGNFLGFQFNGTASEHDHLRPLGEGERAKRIQRAKELAARGDSQREIARQLGVGLSTANKYINAPEQVNAGSANDRERVRTPANDTEDSDYREPTKSEWEAAASDPAEWARLTIAAERAAIETAS
jgi:hypothetical protein